MAVGICRSVDLRTTFRTGLRFGALAVAETAFLAGLRLFLKSDGTRIFSGPISQAEFHVSTITYASIAYFALFHAVGTHEDFPAPQFDRRFAVANFVTIFFTTLLMVYREVFAPFPGVVLILFAISSLSVAVTAFFVRFPIRHSLELCRRHRKRFALAAVALGAYPAVVLLQTRLWEALSRSFGWSVTLWLNAVRIPASLSLPADGAGATLSNGDLALWIGPLCSGTEGLFVLLFVTCLLLLLNEDAFNGYDLEVFLGGIVFVCVLNCLRLFLLFVAGLWMAHRYGTPFATQTVEGAAHSNFGLVLYAVGFFFYFNVTRYVLSSRKITSEP